MLSFTILTTEAYEGIRDLHTRTPMILDEQGRKSWLEGEPPALASDIDTAIRFYPVSTRVNKPSYDAPDCIEALVELAREGAFRDQRALRDKDRGAEFADVAR